MNIRQIKDRADDLLRDCKPQVIRILIIMLLIGSIPSLLDYNNFLFGIISFVLAVLFVPFSHGQIVTALKIVRNNKSALSDEDALVGFHRFKELFVTYFLTGLFVIVVAFIMIIVAFVIFGIMFGSTLLSASSVYGALGSTNFLSYADLLNFLGIYGPMIIVAFLLFVLVVAVIMVILSLYLYAVPYLLEQYHIKEIDAIKESFLFIKGNVWNLFKLQFSFIGWILLFAIVEYFLLNVLASFLPALLAPLIASIIAGGLAIYVYMPRYIVSMAIFFEEIAYYRYKSNQ